MVRKILFRTIAMGVSANSTEEKDEAQFQTQQGQEGGTDSQRAE